MPEKRSYYEKLAAERGYRAVDSVTAALTLLVAADVNDSSSKLRNARKSGVKIVSLNEFLAAGETVAADNEFSDLPLFG
jgi:NAD-dependent DNA ligase